MRLCFPKFNIKKVLQILIALLIKIRGEDDPAQITFRDLMPKNYSYLRPPLVNGTSPVIVEIVITSLNIRSVDESDMSFTVSIEFYQVWTDHRLIYPTWAKKEYTILDSSWISNFWNPNIYFVNAVDGKLNDIITPSSLLWMNSGSKVFYGCRLSLKLICEMDLKYFPHDEQKCGIEMASAIFNDLELILSWPTTTRRKMEKFSSLQQFEIYNLERGKCMKASGQNNVSCLEETVILRRRSGYYLINVYIPTVLIVIMSMLTFWIPYDAVPARVTLGVTSLLTIITKQYQASMPNVSYIVALNVWLSCCIGFVFLSLLEFATVIAMSTKLKQDQHIFPNQPDMMLPMVILKSNGTWRLNHFWQQMKNAENANRPKKLDHFSRFFFPLCFIIFCITYWCCYS